MLRHLGRIFCFAILVGAGSVGMWWYQGHNAAEAERRRLQERNEQLQQIVKRLSSERRVAEVIVTDQKTIDGQLQTTLLFVEHGRDDKPLVPRSFSIRGNSAHIDALVIKFDRDYIENNDPLRGRSIVLFYRIFGDHQNPADAFLIDRPGEVPEGYRGDDSRAGSFERELWAGFWRLADDETYRKSKGVRVANRESPWGPFEPGKLYTLTLEAAGGLNIASEPVKPIYLEALKARLPTK